VQTHEDFGYGLGQPFVHREAFTLPVDRVAQASHLLRYRAAGMGLPFPHPLHEFFAAKARAGFTRRIELPFHHHLGGDAGVIGARLP
jgi:hypothetical protein